MSTHSNGISLNAKRYNDTLVVNLKPSGQPSGADFHNIAPRLEAALYSIQSPHVTLLVDITELDGWGLKAAWSEFLLGLRLGAEFDRIAIYSKHSWQNFIVRATSWLISNNIKAFKRYDEATDWVMSS